VLIKYPLPATAVKSPVCTDCQSTSTCKEKESPKAREVPLTVIVELESLALAIVLTVALVFGIFYLYIF
jgi:hypothetical protein